MQLPDDAPLSDHLMVLFAQMSRAIARHPGQLTRAEYAVVSVLDQSAPQRVSDLAGADGCDASTVSRRVAALAERDLVVRTPDPDDGRAHRTALTDRGRAVLHAERRRRADLVTDALAGWSASDRADLTRLLARLSTSLAERAATPERTTA
jgi:DNA-binding MarR family transcriptional regulator